ncbi:MAG: hypothetical protein U5J96_15820 [Ignavibacteriaceae bacterium]|nr:hypothetical protein [Ignavibacteriaceae bacterium]
MTLHPLRRPLIEVSVEDYMAQEIPTEEVNPDIFSFNKIFTTNGTAAREPRLGLPHLQRTC